MIALLACDPLVGLALITLRPNVWYVGPVTLLDELYAHSDPTRTRYPDSVAESGKAASRRRGSEILEINVD